jgi:hypothetical protein
MSKKYRTLEQLVCLISFPICAGVIASLTLILKTLMLCGCFRQRAKPDAPDYSPISADGRLKDISA